VISFFNKGKSISKDLLFFIFMVYVISMNLFQDVFLSRYVNVNSVRNFQFSVIEGVGTTSITF